jgi:plasmid stabilization system protein ParE
VLLPARFALSPRAQQDIDDIWDFVFAQSRSLAIADRVLAEIFATFDLLADHPNAGHLREDLTDKSLRFWNVYRYLIVYDPSASPIGVVAVISGGQDVHV